MHSTDVTARLVSSYLAFSPLPAETGGCFLLHDLTLADYFPLRSGVPYIARTFLPPFLQKASDRLPDCFYDTKVIKYSVSNKLNECKKGVPAELTTVNPTFCTVKRKENRNIAGLINCICIYFCLRKKSITQIN
jgi:hypothetical protein